MPNRISTSYSGCSARTASGSMPSAACVSVAHRDSAVVEASPRAIVWAAARARFRRASGTPVNCSITGLLAKACRIASVAVGCWMLGVVARSSVSSGLPERRTTSYRKSRISVACVPRLFCMETRCSPGTSSLMVVKNCFASSSSVSRVSRSAMRSVRAAVEVCPGAFCSSTRVWNALAASRQRTSPRKIAPPSRSTREACASTRVRYSALGKYCATELMMTTSQLLSAIASSWSAERLRRVTLRRSSSLNSLRIDSSATGERSTAV